MGIPLTVTFRNMSHSAALEAAVRRRVDKLEPLANITSCAATIDAPHRHRQAHRPFIVHLRLKVPGKEIVVSDDGPEAGHQDAYVALAEAFDAARRQLQAAAQAARESRRRA